MKEKMTIAEILIDIREKENDLFERFKPLEDKVRLTDEEQKEWEKLVDEMWKLSDYKRKVTAATFETHMQGIFNKAMGLGE